MSPTPRQKTAPQQVIPAVHLPDEPSADELPDELPGSAEELRVHAERWFARLRRHVREPGPPPGREHLLDCLLWGLAQPALGLRLLLREGDLLVRAAVPVAVTLVICALVALGAEEPGIWGWIKSYYGTLTAAAAISPVLFTRNYARLAADARPHLELEPHPPYLRSYGQALVESVLQLIVLGVGIAPLVAVVQVVPLLGWLLGVGCSAAWTLHWVVVEGLDSARTLPPGEDPESLEARHELFDPPWYTGEALTKLREPLDTLTLPLRLWGRILARLGQRWRSEVAFVEQHPLVSVGFGLGAAVLLAIPVVNLLFRPAVVVAASHLLGHLGPELPAGVEEQVEGQEAALQGATTNILPASSSG